MFFFVSCSCFKHFTFSNTYSKTKTFSNTYTYTFSNTTIKLIQPDNKLKLGPKVENWELSMIAWWHCTMRTPMTTWPLSLTSTLSERECALFRFFLCVSTSHLAHTHRGSSNESFTPSTCPCSCERFSSPCSPLLLHALPAALLPFPPALEVRRLQPTAHSAQRKYGLHRPFSSSPQVMSPTPTTSRRPQSSLTRSSWTRRRSSPTESPLRTPTTMTLHSRVCFAKLTGYIAITLHEKTCLSVCRRRQCSTERGDPLETERGDLLSKETRKHRLGLCSTNKKNKFLQNAK